MVRVKGIFAVSFHTMLWNFLPVYFELCDYYFTCNLSEYDVALLTTPGWRATITALR